MTMLPSAAFQSDEFQAIVERLRQGCSVCGGPALCARLCPNGQHFTCGMCYIQCAFFVKKTPPCPVCRGIGAWKDARVVENFYSNIVCEACERPQQFANVAAFKAHAIREHRPAPCEVCDCDFESDANGAFCNWDSVVDHMVDHVHNGEFDPIEEFYPHFDTETETYVSASPEVGDSRHVFVHTPTIALTPTLDHRQIDCEQLDENPLR